MGNWNRPSEKPRQAAKKPSIWRGVIAGVVAAILGIAAIFIFKGDDVSAPSTKHKAPSTIREVTPAAAPTNVVEKAEEKPKELPPQRVGETRNGKILLPNGRLHTVKGVITNNSGLVKMKYEIFAHPSENVIAGLLSIQPGQGLVGTPRYNGRITKDFLESLKEPIVIKESDSEEDKELKRAVREAKIELKAAYDRGEDIEKILLDERRELQKLGNYKRELQAMTLQSMRDAQTPEEMDDAISAANKMLEAKGIAPLDPGPLGKIKLRMMELKEKTK